MSIYVGNSEPKEIYVGTTPVKEVYVGTTKVRPSITPITTSGIYHNATLGLISLSNNGSTWLTIADKNLGATQVWNSGDTLSEANCGKFYQRGNNYGFPYTGPTSTSSNQVNASTYGPGNYYSSSVFITGGRWDSSNNGNLRGGTTGTYVAMKGPCDTGFHIPSESDANTLKGTISSLGISDIHIYLKIPYTKYIDDDGTSVPTSNYALTWTSIDYYYTYGRATMYRGNSAALYDYSKTCGLHIRPFKNEAVQPDTSWTKLY